MSAIEQGLLELGLLEMTMKGCLQTGLSIKDFLAKAIASAAIQPSSETNRITDEERNKLANAVYQITMQKANENPEYLWASLRRTAELTGHDMSSEEARFLCQD